MAYATESYFRLIVGDREASALVADEATGEEIPGRLVNALDAASADIDVLLGGRFDVVAAQHPTFLQLACVHIARWHLSGAGAIETDPITRRHKFYVERLSDLADGNVGDSGSAGGASLVPDEAVVVQAAPPRRWGRGCF